MLSGTAIDRRRQQSTAQQSCPSTQTCAVQPAESRDYVDRARRLELRPVPWTPVAGSQARRIPLPSGLTFVIVRLHPYARKDRCEPKKLGANRQVFPQMKVSLDKSIHQQQQPTRRDLHTANQPPPTPRLSLSRQQFTHTIPWRCGPRQGSGPYRHLHRYPSPRSPPRHIVAGETWCSCSG